MPGEKLCEVAADVVRQQIPQEMIVEEDSCHVVARSGILGEGRYERRMFIPAERSPNRRRPSPFGTVSTPKPRSRTSTGPPLSSFQR